MTELEFINTMLNRIVDGFDPLRIVLFGSQARGDANWQSDFDILVVMSGKPNKREQAIRIRKKLADLPFSKDIIVSSPDEIKRRGKIIGTVINQALNEGKTIYAKQ